MTLLTLFVIFGFLKSRFIMDNSYIIGNFPAIIALSFALAKRVKIIKQNKEKRERELEKSIKKFESIIAYNNDIFWETDQHSTFRYVSSNVKNVLGWSDKEMIGKKAFELVTKEEIKRMTAVLSKAAKENKPVLNYEYKMKSKSGEWIILEKNAKPFYSKEGKLEGFRGNDRDITAYYQYKEILRESEEKYKTIIENTNMGILIIDDKYHISYANPRFEKITGYKFKDIENQDFRELLSPDTGKEISINDKMLRQKKKDILNYEIKIVHKNKSLIPVKAYIKAITKISGDSSYIIQIIDISEQKQLEDQLIMSQKMEAIGTLAGGIAHDFNNLLTVIKGYSEVLLTNLDTKDPRLKHVSTILSASEKAEALTKQILAFSRRQIYQTQQLDINRQLSEFLKMAGRIIGEDISIETDFNEEIPLIQADPGQIDQIMINLLINARDAITQNTNSSEKKIMITTQLAAEKDISKFNITNANSGKYVEIMISDTGIGMKDDIKNKIFEPFFTTKDKDSNTGLGLATVYGIIAQNKGFIDVESTINKGTRFKIYWPVNPNKTDWQQ
jgi:PAS domain S-box-containing protein